VKESDAAKKYGEICSCCQTMKMHISTTVFPCAQSAEISAYSALILPGEFATLTSRNEGLNGSVIRLQFMWKTHQPTS